jgi:hypothetical protein
MWPRYPYRDDARAFDQTRGPMIGVPAPGTIVGLGSFDRDETEEYYVPTDADWDVIGRLYGTTSPPWDKIQADLLRLGQRGGDLPALSAEAIVTLLGDVVSRGSTNEHDDIKTASKRFAEAYAKHGDTSPMMVAVLNAERHGKGVGANIPPEVVHPAGVGAGVPECLILSGESSNTFQAIGITLYGIGRTEIGTSNGVMECNFVLRGPHVHERAKLAVDTFRELARESGAILLSEDIVPIVGIADSPLLLWVASVFGLLVNTDVVQYVGAVGKRDVFQFHPFAASVEAWKVLKSKQKSKALTGKKEEVIGQALHVVTEGEAKSNRFRLPEGADESTGHIHIDGAGGPLWRGEAFTIEGGEFVWISEVALEAGDRIRIPLSDNSPTPAGSRHPSIATEAWSAPMSKTEMARRITGKKSPRPREVAAFLEKHGLRHVKGHKWQVRLDTMDDRTRAALERPLE